MNSNEKIQISGHFNSIVVLMGQITYKAAERIFIWGAKTKKGTVMSKRALTVYMRILITNDLMKHHCRHKVSIYMLNVVF